MIVRQKVKLLQDNETKYASNILIIVKVRIYDCQNTFIILSRVLSYISSNFQTLSSLCILENIFEKIIKGKERKLLFLFPDFFMQKRKNIKRTLRSCANYSRQQNQQQQQHRVQKTNSIFTHVPTNIHTPAQYETWQLFKEIVIIIIGFLLLLPFLHLHSKNVIRPQANRRKFLLQKENFLYVNQNVV